MKKILTFTTALLLALPLFPQGIEFEHGTWKEALEKAQKLNKLVFVDVFASWCGPCKMMSKEIFPLEEVGKVYNADFVCYKTDAEIGEGKDIAKKYEVTAYPTYLFIKPDGTLFYKALGSMDAKSFIGKSEEALTELKSGKTISEWEKEYAEKKNDPEFLMAYIQKRAKLEMPTSQLLNEYLQLVPESKWVTPEIASLYEQTGNRLKINTPSFENLKKNGASLEKLMSNPKAISSMISNCIMTSLQAATKAKDDKLFASVVNAYDSISLKEVKFPLKRNEIFMFYYLENDSVKYLSYAVPNCRENLMIITNDSLEKKGQANLNILENAIRAGRVDTLKMGPEKTAELKTRYKNAPKENLATSLNIVASVVLKKSTDKKLTKEAIIWSARATELSPSDTEYMHTYAKLLYKTGKKKEAIRKESEALQIAQKGDNQLLTGKYATTVEKMKKGEKI